MKKISHIKKGNLWYPPTKSIYSYLTHIEKLGLPKTLAVLGCADGNYVIPAARRGFKVLAIDIDKIALYGGQTCINGHQINIVGMRKKLIRLGLEKSVTIVDQSYLEYQPEMTYSGVITSESTHYEINTSKYSLIEMIDKIKSYVSVNGILLFEHLHLCPRNSNPKRYFTLDSLNSLFKNPQWKIISNKNKIYSEEPNIRTNEFHQTILGRLYAVKINN